MQIQINTDHNIDGNERLAAHVQTLVSDALERFSSQITRIEVHLSDENSDKKSGGKDKRCLLEARLAGMQPIAVTDHAETVEQAIQGACDKLTHSLDSTLGRLSTH